MLSRFSKEILAGAAKVSEEIKKAHNADLVTLASQLASINDAIEAFINEGIRITYFSRIKEITLKESHPLRCRVQEGNCTNVRHANEQLLIH